MAKAATGKRAALEGGPLEGGPLKDSTTTMYGKACELSLGLLPAFSIKRHMMQRNSKGVKHYHTPVNFTPDFDDIYKGSDLEPYCKL
jgi:hypothetical protein